MKKNCKHEFIGSKDGVKCKLCGLTMTPSEYAEFLKSKDDEVKGDEKDE